MDCIAQIANVICPAKPILSFYSDPADCQAYVYCLRGVAHPGSCTGNLYFNPTTKKCDDPANVPCSTGKNPVAITALPVLTTAQPITASVSAPPAQPCSTTMPVNISLTPETPITIPSPPPTSPTQNPSLGNPVSGPPPPPPPPPPPTSPTQNPSLGNPVSGPSPPPPPPPISNSPSENSPSIPSPNPAPIDNSLSINPTNISMSAVLQTPSQFPGGNNIAQPPENPSSGVTPNSEESPSTETTPAEVTKAPITVRSLPGKFPHEFSCMNQPCGIYPNINDCSLFIVCSEGIEITKHCNDGQLFDTRTLECQNSEKAQCWQEPTTEPSRARPEPRFPCRFHNKSSTLTPPTETVYLSSPVVTNWGTWDSWQFCPANTYVNGIYVWRQLVRRGASKVDHAGIVSVSFNCASVNGDRVTNIASNAPFAPPVEWPTHYSCVGTGIGFRMNSQSDQGAGDDLATDNIQVICSCGPPVYKRYDLQTGEQSGDRGTWTEPQICLPKQALCGMITQMVPFTQDGSNDNTGLNNLKMKCCDVPNPADTCIPMEEMRLVRKCSNVEGKFHRRCDFASSIGLAYDISVDYNTLNFYGSIGFTLNDTRDVLMTKFSELVEKNVLNVTHEYHWDSPHEKVYQKENTTEHFIYINVNTTTELYQIVGKCSPYEIRTNWLVQIDTDVNSGEVEKTYYEI